jgi:hypothetical protein
MGIFADAHIHNHPQKAGSDVMLNDAQRRRISVTLSSLEEDVHDMERLLKSEDYIGIVYEMVNDVSATARDVLIDKMALIKEKVRSLEERFSLDREQRTVSRQIFARLTYDWTTLEEIKASHLTGYGAVAEGLKDSFDPELDEIIGLIREMEALLQTGKI